MHYTLEKVSEDSETKQHILVLKQKDGEDRLALKIREKEALVLESLLAPGGLPGQDVLDHLRDSATRSTGQVIGIQLLLYGEKSQDVPALTPVLIVRKEGGVLDQAVPASLAHAAAWALALELPFEMDDHLLGSLQATVTLIPGEAPSAFKGLLADMDEIDQL